MSRRGAPGCRRGRARAGRARPADRGGRTPAHLGLTAIDRIRDLSRRLQRPGAGLLLDLDGTLVDSEPVHRAAFVEYFGSRGWCVPDDVVRQFSGRRAQEVFSSLDGPWRDDDPDELTEAVLAVLAASRPAPVPVDGAQDLLVACTRTGLPVAVVTSARQDWARAVVGQLTGPDRPILPMITAEDCTHGKPDPEPYRRGAELLGLEPGGLVAAEDTPAGLDSARAAGVGYLIGMTTSHGAGVLAGADLVADDLRILVDAVRGERT